MINYLTNLADGQKASIKSLSVNGTMRRRLQDIGLIEGAKVECLHRSPFGDPIAFVIRGAVIALRAADCAAILIDAE